MAEEKKAVVAESRLAGITSIPQEKVTHVMGIDEVMKRDNGGVGQPMHLMNIIEDSYSTAPGFVAKEGGRIEPIPEIVAQPEKPEPRNAMEAIENDPLMKRYDCSQMNGGCGGTGTVQPVNSTGVDWECSQCGKAFTLSK